jgi:predicted RNA binding protein YcfA (HicA-like mRNA interferase family)
MANCAKLLSKAQSSPHNLKFEEVCALAKCYGWNFVGGDGSHRVYMHPSLGNSVGSMMNFQSKKGKAKAYQVRQLLGAIEGLNHG